MDEQKYTDWFNKGYALSKHKPELASQISAALDKKDDDRALGFINGHQEYFREIGKSKETGYKEHLNYTPTQSIKGTPGKEKGIEKEK